MESLRRGTQYFQGRAVIWMGLLGFLFLGIFAGGFFLLAQSSLFAIEHIQVEGNQAISTEEVLSRVGPMLRGQSLLQRSFSDAERALAEIPFTESVELDRNFPRTIRILIREHRPFVSLKTEDNKALVLSLEGKALMVSDLPAEELPVLSAAQGSCAVDPGQLAGCPEVAAGLWFLANIPVNFNQEFAEVLVSGNDIELKTRSGVTVRFGSLEEYGLKLEVLRQLLALSVAAGKDVVIDVSVPERPVTKDAPPPAATTARPEPDA